MFIIFLIEAYYAYIMLKIKESITVMTKLQNQRGQLPLILVETQWYSLKPNCALKLHPNVKVQWKAIVSTMGLFSIIRFNIRSLIAKCVQFLKSSAVKAGLNVFSSLKLCLSYP